MVPESPCTPPMSPQLKADATKAAPASAPARKMDAETAPKPEPVEVEVKSEPVTETISAPSSSPGSETSEDPKTEPKTEQLSGKPMPEDEALSDVSSDSSSGGDYLTLPHLHVRIQTRPDPAYPNAAPVFERVALPEFKIPLPATLEGLRESLLASRLGAPERDIFFPQWTKSLYVAWESTPADGEGEAETVPPETIDSDGGLAAALERAGADAGSESSEKLVVLLQECRNARYSRARARRAVHHRGYQSWGIPIYAEAKRADGAVYFDQPLYAAFPFSFPPQTHAAAHAAAAAAANAGYGVDQFQFMSPYGLVPYVYAPQARIGH